MNRLLRPVGAPRYPVAEALFTITQQIGDLVHDSRIVALTRPQYGTEQAS